MATADTSSAACKLAPSVNNEEYLNIMDEGTKPPAAKGFVTHSELSSPTLFCALDNRSKPVPACHQRYHPIGRGMRSRPSGSMTSLFPITKRIWTLTTLPGRLKWSQRRQSYYVRAQFQIRRASHRTTPSTLCRTRRHGSAWLRKNPQQRPTINVHGFDSGGQLKRESACALEK